MYELTYQFEGSGGNIQYQTKQRVETEATSATTEVEVVSTGLSLDEQAIDGIAIVDIEDDVEPKPVFESATRVRHADALVDPEAARDLVARTDLPDATESTRFELSKIPMVVGKATHGPGQTDVMFRRDDGDLLSNRALADRSWDDDCDIHFHPLGVLVEGDLYRPVKLTQSGAGHSAVGDPIQIATYRGSSAKPWQFGITRLEDQLLLTQARAGPSKFDPVLKRFPVESQPLGEEPLVFNHTVSRRVWSEDPATLHVQSHRSEGLQTEFLYKDTDGWHLIQPKVLADDDADSESFEPTQLDGVSVRSALLRAETAGETKATVEHEYRITPAALDACDRLYVLSYYEANEESFDRLQWDITEATAFRIINNSNFQSQRTA